MPVTLLSTKSLSIFVLATFAAVSQAQWMAFGGNSTSMHGDMSSAGAAYGGFADVKLSNIVDGGNDGVPGLSDGHFTNLTPTFLANYATNAPDGSIEGFGTTYNHTLDAYDVTIDFTGMTNGVLPTGTIMAFLDTDIQEEWHDILAFDSTAKQLAVPWVTPVTGARRLLDYNNTGGDSTAFVTAPAFFSNIFGYQLLGDVGNMDSVLFAVRTTADISRITFHFQKGNGGSASISGGNGIGFYAAPVPEPATLLTIGSCLLAIRFRKRRQHVR